VFVNLTPEFAMSTDAVTPLRQRMIEDMCARQLTLPTQKGHIRAYKRFAAFLKRSPDTATAEDIRRFQLRLAESGGSAAHLRSCRSSRGRLADWWALCCSNGRTLEFQRTR
jgi:hypothetical protein